MYCDYMIILIIGLACSWCSYSQAYTPKQIVYGSDHLRFQPVCEQRHRLMRHPLIRNRPHYKSPNRREEEDFLRYKPFYGGFINFRKQYNLPNKGAVYLKVPKQKVLSMISVDELTLLYKKNLAYDVPVNSPSEPQQIAISSALVENLLKIKNGVGDSVRGVAGVVGGLFNGIFGTVGDSAKNLVNVFWVNQG